MQAPDGIVLSGVGRRFRTPGGEVVSALDGVDITIAAGSLTVIAGPSGSGKSTLLGVIGCTDRADDGVVTVAGVDVGALSRRARREFRRTSVAVVVPRPSDNLLEALTAAENVRWVASVSGRPEPDVVDAFARLGLTTAMDKHPRQLSGGEQQRVAVAAAMASGAAVIAADEPTASLDGVSGGDVIDALLVAARAGATVVVASHDHALIDAADHVVWLDHGRVVS